MSERGDQTRTVTLTVLIEDSTPEVADEYVANLRGLEVQAMTSDGLYAGEIQEVST